MRKVPTSKRRWVSKQVSNHFAHGKNMVRWKQRNTAECPRCATEVEDKLHIIRCPQQEASSIWESALLALNQWLKAEDTAPAIIHELITGLQSWYQGSPAQQRPPATNQQSLIGWAAVLDGWIGIQWHLQQEAFWAQWKRRKSSKRWTTELIKKLWNIAWDMWDHRNGILHHMDQPRHDILDSAINDQIRQLFSHGLQAVPRDAFTFFRRPMEEILSSSRWYKERWVASVQAAIRRKQQHDYGAHLAEQRFMRRWLGLE